MVQKKYRQLEYVRIADDYYLRHQVRTDVNVGVDVRPRPAGGSVSVKHLSKVYLRGRDKLAVIDDLTLEANAGEFISIIGPSGSGKSTLFNILAGLERPDAGEVLVSDKVVTGVGREFAYMPQRDLLMPWRRVVDNAILGLEIQAVKKATARARVAPMLKEFGLDGFEQSYPSELSGGMKQRVALLRTVVQERRVILLDEPFGALDYLTRTELQLWLTRLWQAHLWTVILVTHDIPEAILMSDRVYVLAPRPTYVQKCVPVSLPRPRGIESLASPEFAELEALILDEFRSGFKS
jgi:ABC-type nitrate/sulfonate/bicarbonate transport system ATPase subunit